MEAKLANTSGSGCNKSSYNFSVSASCKTRTCTRYGRQVPANSRPTELFPHTWR